MKKEEVLALIADKKAVAVQVFDDISAAVESIEVEVIGGDAELQKQLDDAKAALADAQAQLQAKSDELAAVQAAKSEEDAQLADSISKLQADEEKLAKLKAFVAELVG
jgi:DNA repair exonuclease SbcCD ATPase subunit